MISPIITELERLLESEGNDDPAKYRHLCSKFLTPSCVRALIDAVKALEITEREIECYCTNEGIAANGNGFPCAHCMTHSALTKLKRPTQMKTPTCPNGHTAGFNCIGDAIMDCVICGAKPVFVESDALRAELHQASRINDEEYAALCQDTNARDNMDTIDNLRSDLAASQQTVAVLREALEDIQEQTIEHTMQYDDGDITLADFITRALATARTKGATE